MFPSLSQLFTSPPERRISLREDGEAEDAASNTELPILDNKEHTSTQRGGGKLPETTQRAKPTVKVVKTRRGKIIKFPTVNQDISSETHIPTPPHHHTTHPPHSHIAHTKVIHPSKSQRHPCILAHTTSPSNNPHPHDPKKYPTRSSSHHPIYPTPSTILPSIPIHPPTSTPSPPFLPTSPDHPTSTSPQSSEH